MNRPPHYPSLISGLTIIILGTIALLASLDVITLTLSTLWPLFLGCVGIIVLTYGVTRR